VKYFKYFYRDSIVCKVNYEDTRNTSITCYYAINKQKAIEKHYYKGKPQGLDVSYYKNGNMFSYTYVDSLIDYPLILLNKDGNFSFVSTISEKKNTGRELHYNGYGDLWQKTECIDSTKRARIFTEYTNCGDTMYQCIIRKGKQPITFYLTSTSEKICEGYIYNSYELYVGKWKSWYHNGQIKQEYEYDDNSRTLSTPIGHWLYYNEEGKIIKEEFYDQGELMKTIKH
jgi:antitoxin component YwqK of YwqJK toxin-antitoxin module